MNSAKELKSIEVYFEPMKLQEISVLQETVAEHLKSVSKDDLEDEITNIEELDRLAKLIFVNASGKISKSKKVS